ncbi:hypothetical protein ACFX2J_028861 [Malus domestica]
MYTTRLEVGAFVDIEISVPEESRKPSSFFVHRSSKIKPRRPLDQQSSTFKIKPRRPLDQQSSTFKIKPRRPLKKAPSFIIRSSKIKPQRPFGSTTSTNPHVQPFFKIKPKSPWRSVHHCSSKIKPKSPFEDPLKSTFKIK